MTDYIESAVTDLGALSANKEMTLNHRCEIITATLGAARNLTLTPGKGLAIGSVVYVANTPTAAVNLTVKHNSDTIAVIGGTANTRATATLVYNGTTWLVF